MPRTIKFYVVGASAS
jgi:hypothetical protein